MDKANLKTAVFVDYEYWWNSQEQQFHTLPNIGIWINDLKARGEINELTFFGDFTNTNLFGEIKAIRAYTNRIIDTRQTGNFKKDFTDFIMLDHIYQKVISAPDIDQVILFTGDAHFASVASYLRLSCNKMVGLYGISNTISQQLINIADWVIEFPFPDEYLESYIRLIIENFQQLAGNPRLKPSFKKTAEYISWNKRVDYSMVCEALEFMLSKGYLYRENVMDEEGSEIQFKYLCANWNLLRADGYIT